MSIKAVNEFLSNWEKEANAYYLLVIKQGLELEDAHRRANEGKNMIESMSEWKSTVGAYWSENQKAKDMLMDSCWRGDEETLKEHIAKVVNKERVRKEKALMDRVKKAIGKVVDTEYLKIGLTGELEGVIVGENGKVSINTIFAGGYNIQRLHYRVLIKKMK